MQKVSGCTHAITRAFALFPPQSTYSSSSNFQQKCRAISGFITVYSNCDGSIKRRCYGNRLVAHACFVMRHILDGLPGCANILDDVLVHGCGTAEHDSRLRDVLDRLAKYGATLRAEKCLLGQPEVDFNGHRVSADGVQPLQSNVAALERIAPPLNQRQLSRFVGAKPITPNSFLSSLSSVNHFVNC